MRRTLASLVAAVGLTAAAAPANAAGDAPTVLAIHVTSEIDPVSAHFVSDSIDRAESEHDAALVILLDTPGGLSTSMDDIIKDELNARVPVIVYVSPAGARAASAGAFIAEAADVAAMNPSTN